MYLENLHKNSETKFDQTEYKKIGVAEFTTKTAGYRISELLRFGLDVFNSLNI
mgnify:CR=1 FL=1